MLLLHAEMVRVVVSKD